MSGGINRKWVLATTAAVVLTYFAVGLYQGFSITASALVLPAIVGNLFVVAGIAHWMIQERKKGVPIADERSQVIDGKAAKLTLIVGVYFMMALTFYDLTAQFISLPTKNAAIYLAASAMFLVFCFLFTRWYFGRRPTR